MLILEMQLFRPQIFQMHDWIMLFGLMGEYANSIQSAPATNFTNNERLDYGVKNQLKMLMYIEQGCSGAV